MVEIFKTNVENITESKVLLQKLSRHFPTHRINFDLDDRDKILRVQGKDVSVEKIIQLLNKENYQCKVLE
jgi:hypothetical protein